MCLVELGIHVGAEVADLAIDPVESSVHVGSEIGELAVDDFKVFIYEFELADDFAKVGVDLDSHVVEVLLGGWFVHGLIVVVNHGCSPGGESEIVCGIH